MAGFADEATLKAAYDANKVIWRPWRKTFANSDASQNWISSYRLGQVPVAEGDPATTPGTAYSNAGISFPDISPVRKFLFFQNARSDALNTNWSCFLFDRLVGVSGIVITSTGDKTINSTALTRYTDGVGVMAFVEVTTAGATTTPVIGLKSYTNQSGTAGQVGGSITFTTASNPVNTLIGPFPLAAGDTGIKSVETINVSTAATTTGTVNLILVKPISVVSGVSQGDWVPERIRVRDAIRIYDGFTGMIAWRANGTGTPTASGKIGVVYG